MYWNDDLVLMSTELTFEFMEPYIFVLLHFSACVYAQWHPTFCDPVDCSPPGSSVRGITQARMLRVGCHFFLQGSFLTQGLNPVSCTGRRILYHCSFTLWPKSEKIPRYRKESSLCEWTVKEKYIERGLEVLWALYCQVDGKHPKDRVLHPWSLYRLCICLVAKENPWPQIYLFCSWEVDPFSDKVWGKVCKVTFFFFPLGPPCEWSFFNSKTFTRRQQWDCWGIFFFNTLAMPKWLAFFFFLFLSYKREGGYLDPNKRHGLRVN